MLSSFGRGVLDGLCFIENDAAPRDLLECFDVANCGAVGGDDDIGSFDFGGDVLVVRATRAVMDNDRKLRSETTSFCCPVADNRRRCNNQRRRVADAVDKVSEDRWCLAKTHIECETAAKVGGVEELEPCKRIGLIAAQFALEAVRVRGGRKRGGRGLGHEIGGPTGTVDRDASSERRTIEPECLAQHFCACHLRLLCAFGERLRGSSKIGVIECYPAAVCSNKRTCFFGQARDVGSGEFDVVEYCGPADVRELVRADRSFTVGFGEDAKRRCGLAA